MGYLLRIILLLTVDDIDKRAVFQIDLVLLYVLADGVACLLVGVLNSLLNQLGNAVDIAAGVPYLVADAR